MRNGGCNIPKDSITSPSECSRFTKDDWLDLIAENLVKEEWIDRIIENENLRQFIIQLRDDPPVSLVEVVERLTGRTEDLKP